MMSFDQTQIDALSAPLDRAHVANRSQAGRQLSYVEGWHCIAEANRIFGYAAWDRETTVLRLLGEPRLVGDKYRVGYMATVRITVRAGDAVIVRDGSGFGSGIDKDVDQAHESAIKEAETDAMKRGLMTFGNPFGLALYDKSQSNVVDAARVERSAARIERDTPPRAPVATSDIDAKNVADLLIEALGMARNMDALGAWKREEWKHIKPLPKPEFDRVVAAYKARETDLMADEPASYLEAGE